MHSFCFHQRSQLDDFLFAPIGCEKNGMTLTVLSALARLDIDPWREAASLAQMPRESAAFRMSSLIAELPEKPSGRLDQGDPARPPDRAPASSVRRRARRAGFAAGERGKPFRTFIFATLQLSCWARGFLSPFANCRPAPTGAHAPQYPARPRRQFPRRSNRPQGAFNEQAAGRSRRLRGGEISAGGGGERGRKRPA